MCLNWFAMKNIFKRAGSIFLDIIEAGVMALAIFVMVYLFLFQPHQVNGNSMLPNFHDHENLLTDKISYRFHEPKRGDVVVFKAPRNQEYEYIKRIIGLPGETILLDQGEVFVNDRILEEPYLTSDVHTQKGSFAAEGKLIAIETNHYFVMGDNRSHSSDSREWGLVPRENIVGKAWFRYWPPGSVGLIKAFEYPQP